MKEDDYENFIEEIINKDLAQGLETSKLRFRFPPEPNGFLHIGHAKALYLNFGLGKKYHAPINLRFDDTNPINEEQIYVDAIKKDLKWLGLNWDKECYASDYFDILFNFAITLIKQAKAYVDDQSQELINEQRKTPFEEGIESPYRKRSIEENLDLFHKMQKGEFKEGACVLRAKINMSSPNMHLRDPIMYRIIKKSHHRSADKWNIYPTYDWAHGQSDYIEEISHSLCSIEFENHKPLYNWYLEQIASKEKRLPKQHEFARLNLSYTITSKRKLQTLIQKKIVNGWDDPRMPTLSGLRRRGYRPEALAFFSKKIGIAKRENLIDFSLLEFSIREQLNKIAKRVMVVLDPIKLIIENYPEGQREWLNAENNQEDLNFGSRKIPFSRTLYIEREDFMEEPPKGFFRLSIGKEVRLKNAYIIKAQSIKKDNKGNIIEIYCTYDKDSLSGSFSQASKRKVKGTLHWVCSKEAIEIEARLYDRLFLEEFPDKDKEKDFIDFINPDSLKILKAYAEPSLKEAQQEEPFQFQRIGYFILDTDSTSNHLIFNKTVGLKEGWKKPMK